MKNEYKLMIFISVLSLIFILIGIFCLYDSSLSVYYAYQVGIYTKEENKDEKLNELKENEVEGYCYKKEKQYFVLSIISQNIEEVKEHENFFDGIIKTYHLKDGLNNDEVLELLKGEIDD